MAYLQLYSNCVPPALLSTAPFVDHDRQSGFVVFPLHTLLLTKKNPKHLRLPENTYSYDTSITGLPRIRIGEGTEGEGGEERERS